MRPGSGCTGLESGTLRARLAYDPLGRLWQVEGFTGATPTGTTRFLWDGDELSAEYDAGGNLLRRYVHGGVPGQDDPMVWFEGSTTSNTARRYLFADERGSIVAVTDAQGNPTAINRYDEYGIPDGSGNDIATKGRFRYTGQMWLPELGMYYYKARIYSPTLGRFLQTDPIGYGDGMNLYRYVANDPVNGVDPTGMCEATFGNLIVIWERKGTSSCDASEAELANIRAAGEAFSGSPISFSGGNAIMVFGPSRSSGSSNGNGAIGLGGPSSGSSGSSGNDGGVNGGNLITVTARPQKAKGPPWHGNWCGIGGAGEAINTIDAACRAHDQCYAANGLSALDNLTSSSGALQSCNQRLCNSARKIPRPPISNTIFRIRKSTPADDEYLAAQQIDSYFSSFLMGDNACR